MSDSKGGFSLTNTDGTIAPNVPRLMAWPLPHPNGQRFRTHKPGLTVRSAHTSRLANDDSVSPSIFGS